MIDMRSPRTRLAVSLLTGVAVALVVGGWLGLAVGSAVAIGGQPLLGRLETADQRRRSSRVIADLPLAAVLLASCLRAGRAPEESLAAVADALGGPLGDDLTHVAAALSLGSPPAIAWQPLLAQPATARVARTMVRSWESGTPLAQALDGLADAARAAARADAIGRARAVGVHAAAPLGLCFLPAFVAVGLVPVIVGAVGHVIGTIL